MFYKNILRDFEYSVFPSWVKKSKTRDKSYTKSSPVLYRWPKLSYCEEEYVKKMIIKSC